MTVKTLSEKLALEITAGREGLSKEIKGVFIGDLLSLVMANAKEGELWLTVQGHINSIAVAVLVNLPAIILVQGIQPDEEMKLKANEEKIVVLTTDKSCYEVARALIKILS